MGLAASQARLLFITMRQNDVSAKMQKISNDKLILARDEEEVSAKYNQMLNTPTAFKNTDGTDITYDALMGNTAAANGATNIVTNSARQVVLSTSLASKLGITKPEGTGDDFKKLYPTVEDLIKAAEPTESEKILAATVNEPKTTTNPSNNELTVGNILGTLEATNIKVIKGDSSNFNDDNYNNNVQEVNIASLCRGQGETIKCLYSHCNDTDFASARGTAVERLRSECTTIGNAFAKAIAGDSGATEFYNSYLKSVTSTIISEASTLEDPSNKASGEEKDVWKSTKEQAKNKILTCAREDGGKHRDYVFMADMSVIANMYLAAATKAIGCKNALSMDVTAQQDTKQYNYSTNNYKFSNLNESASGTYKGGAAESGNKTGEVDKNSQQYYNNLKTYYTNLHKALSEKGWTTQDATTIQQNLTNGMYSIDNVKISASDDYIGVIDKDKAEGYYKQEMAKIHKKEKEQDTQLQKLQTEYSGLTSDYESVKSILNANIQKSFTYCQQG